MSRTDSERVVFDETRHTWLCLPPRTLCPKSCACACHRPTPDEPNRIAGWIYESEM